MLGDFLSNRREVWLLDRVARAYGVLPSVLIGLDARCFERLATEIGKPAEAGWGNNTPLPPRLVERGLGGEVGGWLTYTFDRTVWLWGQWVESKLAERDAQGRQVWSLERLLHESGPMTTPHPAGGADQLMALVGEGVRFKP